ncbi:MAG TPA: signal recognition particle-docking protein FtsY [Candidatus Caccosoma faecigallinarum]|uniref:Signal recognition particle receptor FtsY n=1 Tax=Candidatus Caccosoma faecigallinarum TaxID=2840720 RepID=A0A9D1G9M4_9FIRM|nr:signal recognition particle-docking protein FtsY [Candidatus Caccosoma faecigallinarum]
MIVGLFKKIKEALSKKSSTKQEKYVSGLDKSRKNFVDKLAQLQSKYKNSNEEYFDELLQILILSDVGVNTAMHIIDATQAEAAASKITDIHQINEILVDKMFVAYTSDDYLTSEIQFVHDLTVLLIVGVNGVGKTTSIAKLCNRYKKQGKKVLLAAGDTFRAGAIDQLKIWAERVKVDIVTGKENSDPSSVIYDALKKAKAEHYDLLICDTAGRVQTKQHLMDELAKMNRIIFKELQRPADEVLLVIDATTGQNGVLQAKAFFDATAVSGIILTKMDSTSKGGIILAIKDELKIPVKFICFGEKIEDIEEFDLEQYLYGLTKGLEGE